MTSPCTCGSFGFCARHGIRKGPHWFRLCQTREDYRQAWEEGRGPGQSPRVPPRSPPARWTCPVIGGPCDHAALGRTTFYCRLDLPGIPGGCGHLKRARATAILASRIGKPCPW